jgi:hypothetical protein
MFGLQRLSSALNALTGNVLALAGTVAEVNAGLRGRLGLDADAGGPEALAPPAGAHAALPGPPAGAEEESPADAGGNGRARRKARTADQT